MRAEKRKEWVKFKGKVDLVDLTKEERAEFKEEFHKENTDLIEIMHAQEELNK
jgi:hypothetical protein